MILLNNYKHFSDFTSILFYFGQLYGHCKEELFMSRRGDNIHKRKDGRWEGRYIKCRNENNKAVYASVYGKTYAEVKVKLAEAKLNIQFNDDYEKIKFGYFKNLCKY